jgi:hypothetical protein
VVVVVVVHMMCLIILCHHVVCLVHRCIGVPEGSVEAGSPTGGWLRGHSTRTVTGGCR